jgi:hypothetical protein
VESQSKRRRPRRGWACLAAASIVSAGLIGGLGCQAKGQAISSTDAESSPTSNPDPAESIFDAESAHADLVRLAEIESRHDGARRASKLRKQLKRGLSQSGFEVIEVETPLSLATAEAPSDRERESGMATHLFARVAGDARDAILLVAPYGAGVGPSERDRSEATSASGPALLLELARVDERTRDSDAPSPMAWWIALVDGDRSLNHEGAASDLPAAAGFPGIDGFAGWLATQPEAQKIRLVVFVDRVGGTSIAVARDLHSNRTYREVFFDEGVERGHAAFAADRPLSAPLAGQRAFAAHGITPLVAIIGEPLAPRASVPDRGEVGGTGSDLLSAVGDTTAAALARIGDRLARLDAFRIDPLRGGPGDVALPGADESRDVPGEDGDPAVDSSPPRSDEASE